MSSLRRLNAITAHIAASSFESVPVTSPCNPAIASPVPQLAPPDAIFGLNIAYSKDKFPRKLNLGVGAYRTDKGEPYVLHVVKKAEAELLDELQRDARNKEYAICPLSCSSSWSECAGNHKAIFDSAGVSCKEYRYFDTATKGLDFAGICADLQEAPAGSLVLLHVCAHNPTGVDPTPEQWSRLCELCRMKRLLAFFDCAYQGYATGDLDADVLPVRIFEEAGLEFWVAQSYSKNFGLYGDRIGAFSTVQSSSKVADAMLSQMKLIIRPMYSNPPKHGALLVERILTTPSLYQEWAAELKTISDRINLMRKMLFEELVRIKCPGSWGHVTSQIGMFAFTGLNKAQVQRLVKEFHIYMTGNGRISMAGLSTTTVPYLAQCMKIVCSEGTKESTT